ncbi:hypothetical protein FQR65_LT18693 [Abscondita terminalis]|nr:hypothetical protein FQR65_LT18693 [Abscondita terminalis]
MDLDGLHIIAQKADGGLRDALSMFDQIVSFSNKQISYQSVIDNLNILDYDYYFKLTDAILQEEAADSLLIFDQEYYLSHNANFKARTEMKNGNPIMVFGIRAVIEAIDSGKEIESLFVQRGLGGSLFLELKSLIKEHEIGFQQVPIEKLNRITRKNHQGVIAVISPITYQKIEDLIPEIYEKGETPLILMLDGVTDVRNLGAIARTAECSGVHAIIVPKKGSAEINPDAMQDLAGALIQNSGLTPGYTAGCQYRKKQKKVSIV